MSFRDDADVDLESQNPFSDSPEFDRATDDASNTLLDLNNHLVNLAKLVKLLEGRVINSTATAKNCEKCGKIIESSTELFKKLSEQCKQLNDYADGTNPGHVFTKDRINRETKDALGEFQSLQERFSSVNAKLNEESRAVLDEVDHHEAAEPQQQEMIVEQDVINNEEFVYQQELIREREEEIANIETGIRELNEIFQDLGTIVQEQGTVVDNIETNIYSVGESTKAAAGELRKALNYQRRSSRKSCYLLTVIIVILLVVVLGIVF